MIDAALGASRASSGRRLLYFSFNVVIFSLVAGVWASFFNRDDGFSRTLALVIVVFASGLFMVYRTAMHLRDPKLLRLGLVFVVKLAFLLLFLGVLWRAVVFTQEQGTWGRVTTETLLEGDQARFYFQADEFARSGFDLKQLPSLNYTGVLYVYGVVFRLFGHNPFAPAVVNAFATLLATLLLVRVGYRIKLRRGPHDWTIGLAMIIPEILLHDVMTSRDALVMSLLTITVLSVALFVLRDARWTTTLLMAIPALLLLAVVRTTALLPAVGSIVLLLVFFRATVSRGPLIVLVALSILVVLIGPLVSRRAGGYEMSYSKILSNTAVTPSEEFLGEYDWSEQSIGKHLVPRSTLGAVFLAIPRVMAYMTAPLPRTFVNWSAVLERDWFGWQGLLVAMSSLLYLALFPCAVASLVESIRTQRSALVLHIPFWFTMLAVASGTAIIHERYRIMAIPLFWGCIWLGQTVSARRLLVSYAAWIVLVLAGVIGVVAYKSVAA